MTEALKSCPFCGGEPRGDKRGAFYAVVCQDEYCPAALTNGWNTEAEAIAAWNTRAQAAAPTPPDGGAVADFQSRVLPWLMECFGAEIAADRVERCDRFIEEALELAQSLGWTKDRAHALVDYVYGRPAGEPHQEVGGVMVTLAALCQAAGLDMTKGGDDELARIMRPEIVAKIRAKQAAKPTGSALPIAHPAVSRAGGQAPTRGGDGPHVTVPREPTEAMMRAWNEAAPDAVEPPHADGYLPPADTTFRARWQAALSAAPPAEAPTSPPGEVREEIARIIDPTAFNPMNGHIPLASQANAYWKADAVLAALKGGA